MTRPTDEELRLWREHAATGNQALLNGVFGPADLVALLDALEAVTRERDEAIAAAAALREALQFQDPRNASARYDRIADEFYRETRLWPPGRSRPVEMGPDPNWANAQLAWREYVDRWHERHFDRALASDAGAALLERLRAAEAVCEIVDRSNGDPDIDEALAAWRAAKERK